MSGFATPRVLVKPGGVAWENPLFLMALVLFCVCAPSAYQDGDANNDGNVPPARPKKRSYDEVDQDSDADTPVWLKKMQDGKIKKVIKAGSQVEQDKREDQTEDVPADNMAVNPFVRRRQVLYPVDPKPVKDNKSKGKKRKSSKKRRRSSSSSNSASDVSNSDSSASHFAAAVFREATKTRSRSSQENLIRFARQHLGRLDCATMQQ